MSTLKTSNIQDTSGNNNSTPEEINQGRAKAWVNFDGTTGTLNQNDVTIRDSFNVTSLTDNGTGDYYNNFTNSFSNTNYCVVTGGYNSNNGDGSWTSVGSGTTNAYPAGVAIGSVRLNTYNNGGSPQDQQAVYVAVFGD